MNVAQQNSIRFFAHIKAKLSNALVDIRCRAKRIFLMTVWFNYIAYFKITSISA